MFGVACGLSRGDSSGHLSAQDQPELKIHGAEKPGLWQLVATGFILLPYTTGKVRYRPHCSVDAPTQGMLHVYLTSIQYPVSSIQYPVSGEKEALTWWPCGAGAACVLAAILGAQVLRVASALHLL